MGHVDSGGPLSRGSRSTVRMARDPSSTQAAPELRPHRARCPGSSEGRGPRPTPPGPSRVCHLSCDLRAMPQAAPPQDRQGPRGASVRAAPSLRARRRPVQNPPGSRPWTAREPVSRCRRMLGTRAGSWPDSRDADSGVTGDRTPQRGLLASWSHRPAQLKTVPVRELGAEHRRGRQGRGTGCGRRGRGAGPELPGAQAPSTSPDSTATPHPAHSGRRHLSPLWFLPHLVSP